MCPVHECQQEAADEVDGQGHAPRKVRAVVPDQGAHLRKGGGAGGGSAVTKDGQSGPANRVTKSVHKGGQEWSSKSKKMSPTLQ